MARTAPIRGSCSHRYFAIFFFFFFCVAMAISFSSGSYGRVEFKLCGRCLDTLGLRRPDRRERCHRTSETAMEKMQIIVIFP